MPNATGFVTGFPQILSEPTTVKAALRRRIRAERVRRTPAERALLGRALTGIALELPEIQAAHCVAIYASMPTEPQTGSLRATLREQRVRVVLPLVRGADLEWVQDTGEDDDVDPTRRVPEPSGRSLGLRGLLMADVVLVPGLAVDTLGTRLGQGGGYYDRALRLLDPGIPVFAVVHDDEVLDAAVEALPAEPHDVPVDGALTPLRCLRLPGRA